MPRAPARTYRLDPETLALILALSRKLGVAQTDILRIAVRRMAAAERVRVEPRPEAEADDGS
jgi:hypothetical protein